ALGLGVRPRVARRAVPAGDVVEAPLDLGGRVGLPVRARGRHLRAGQRLRDAVRAAVPVRRALVPAALLVPELLQAAPLGVPAAGGVHLLAEGLVAARVGVGAGREPERREAAAAGGGLGDVDRAELLAAPALGPQRLEPVALRGLGLDRVLL